MPETLATFADQAWDWLLVFLPRLGGAIVIFAVGYIAARLISRGLVSLLDRTGRLDQTVKPVLVAVVRYGIIVIVLVAALAQLGIPTASLLAALGAAGLAIGLALQGTLANIAAGIMLLWLRPFRVNDSIETAAVAGTVEEVNLFTTRIRTGDGIYKFVPNSLLWSTTITNYTRNPTRLVSVDFGIAYDSDIGKACRVLEAVAARHPKVLEAPQPEASPTQVSPSSVVIQLRAWTATADYGRVRAELTEAAIRALATGEIKTPQSEHVIHIATGAATPVVAAVGAATIDGRPQATVPPPATGSTPPPQV
jgi:small conductance mechanosensitive channel